jgi:elongation factor G
MSRPAPETIRNIGIISHIDAGKTTVSERILFYTDEIHKMGEVHDGLATMDWMDQEQERGITITASCTSCRWNNHWINIIDTPGHIDFTIEVERSLRVLDGALTIFSAVEGVQPQSESVWHQATRYQVPRICMINKMDRIGADYREVLRQIEEQLHGRPALLQLPLGNEGEFRGVVDLLEEQLILFAEDDQGRSLTTGEIPADMQDEAATAREALTEIAADFDDELMADFLDGNPVDADRIRGALRKGTLAGAIFPVLLGSALRNKGIQPVMNAICDYLPAPAEGPPVKATDPASHAESTLDLSEKAPMCALAFKVVSDEGRKLTFLRIYSGKLKAGDTIINTGRDIKERAARLFRMHAHKRQRVDEAFAGDIVAATGIKDVLTGDTLCAPERPLLLESLQVPEPVISLAVEPKDVTAKDKLLPSLDKLQWEDPTFRVHEDEDTGQTILTGMGELHLDVVVQRLERDFGVEVNTGQPQVVYREALQQPVVHRETFQREFEGKAQFGDIEISLTPLERGSGVEITVPDRETGGVQKAWLDELGQSLEQACRAGVHIGYPLTDLKVEVTAIHSPGNTTETGLKAAAQKGISEAARKGKPTLLEPIMELEIIVPSDYAGQVIGGLQQKRGKVEGMNSRSGMEIIKATTPLSEMFGYMTELRSATKGRGTFSMEFSHFDLAPVETLKRFGLM